MHTLTSCSLAMILYWLSLLLVLCNLDRFTENKNCPKFQNKQTKNTMSVPTKENSLLLIPMDIEGKQMREQHQVPSQSLQPVQNPAPTQHWRASEQAQVDCGSWWEQDTESWDPGKTFIFFFFMLWFTMFLVLFSFLVFLFLYSLLLWLLFCYYYLIFWDTFSHRSYFSYTSAFIGFSVVLGFSGFLSFLFHFFLCF